MLKRAEEEDPTFSHWNTDRVSKGEAFVVVRREGR